jgi:hypothetical protein
MAVLVLVSAGLAMKVAWPVRGRSPSAASGVVVATGCQLPGMKELRHIDGAVGHVQMRMAAQKAGRAWFSAAGSLHGFRVYQPVWRSIQRLTASAANTMVRWPRRQEGV